MTALISLLVICLSYVYLPDLILTGHMCSAVWKVFIASPNGTSGLH